MATAGSLLYYRELGIPSNHEYNGQFKATKEKRYLHMFGITLSAHSLRQDAWCLNLLNSVNAPQSPLPTRCNVFLCRSFLTPNGVNEVPVLKTAATVLTKSYYAIQGSPLVLQLIPAVGIIAFAAWGLGPLMRLSRILFLQKSDSSWKKSSIHYVMTSYLQPLLLWSGATLICRALDPVILPTVASQAVKERLLNFVRSLSTVLAFAYCLSSFIQQAQKFFLETKDSGGEGSVIRNIKMGFEFAGKAVYTAVWVASVSLFMELLGYSTQKWLTAGGLGTVLLTLAGREIFTNFLSSVMIHATRPFVVNEWIQTKIQGYEVSGTVEHMGWWSPTIIRGDDREAVHIPNHKFTVNIVRNLSQKTHWRIKTHLAISLLDVNKINIIVADMRKVLAKNPQVEQQRLHRRVFLDNVDPESQALLIMVSCFVKTSRFEEFLCVKEAILLDLLRVISHHRARLATPIRTVQKIYGEADVENIPFSDTVFTRNTAATNRPVLLIEPTYKVSNDDKIKVSTRPGSTNEEKDLNLGAAESHTTSESTTSGATSVMDDSKLDEKVKEISAHTQPDAKSSNSGDDDKAEEISAKIRPDAKSSNTGPTGAHSEDDEASISSPSTARSSLEDNIVLGVALEGSKRTLPIEEETLPSPAVVESKEMATCRNGNGSSGAIGKDKKDDQIPAGPTGTQNDQ